MALLVFRERPGVAQILGRTTAVPASKSTPLTPHAVIFLFAARATAPVSKACE